MIIVYTIFDFIYFPLYVLVLIVFLFFYTKTSRLAPEIKSKLQYGFLTRVLYCITFFIMQQFYFGAGDSFGYYNSIRDLHAMNWELKKGFVTSPTGIASYGSAIFYSFSDIVGYLNTNPSNAAVVKIGYWLSHLCDNSYLTLCFFFSMFAFLGCWKMYLLFTRYYPHLYREFALCLLYLPSVCFWSSGLMKDSLTLGATGLLIFNVHRLLIDKRKIVLSLAQVLIFGYLVLLIKPYILLAITPGLLIWLFMKFNFKGLNRHFRRLITFLFILVGASIGGLLLQYFSSTDYARDLSTENLTQRITDMRDIYSINEESKGGSYFSTGSTNPVLNFPLGIVATLFRPFPWESRNFNMLFSGIEAFVFLLMTLYMFFKLGFVNTFRTIFKNGDTIFFFTFVMVFAAAVGSSTANFGTLVRYKIPCMPFYLMMVFIVLKVTGMPYPKWMNRILGIKRPHKVLLPAKPKSGWQRLDPVSP